MQVLLSFKWSHELVLNQNLLIRGIDSFHAEFNDINFSIVTKCNILVLNVLWVYSCGICTKQHPWSVRFLQAMIYKM